MKYFNIRKLTFRNFCHLGKLKCGKLIGKGSNADVYECSIRKKKYLVKKISFDSTVCYIRRTDENYSLKVFRNKLVDQEIVDNVDLPCQPFAYGYQTIDTDSAKKLILSTSFVNESIVSGLVSNLPFFVRTEDAFAGYKHGNIVMEHAGTPLNTFLKDNELSVDEIKSIVQQVMIALTWAQHKYFFKHHDLHTGNIFVQKMDIPFEYDLPNGEKVRLKSNKYLAKIGDFGFSSATYNNLRYGRCDLHLNIEGREWGKWNNFLSSNTGYDVIMFLGFLSNDVMNEEAQKFAKDVFKFAKKKTRVSKLCLRPLSENDTNPTEILNFIKL